MNKISIAIITLNEERNIRSCLNSVKDLTDDIVVVDSGSVDKTQEICNGYNVRFFHNDFVDYSSQKNYANSLTKYDYVLSLDADECLSPELAASISKIKELENNTVYTFNRLNFHCGKAVRFCGWYPDKKQRFWNKNTGRWSGTIHESFVFDSPPQFIHLKGDLLHYTYNSKEEHLKQAKKFAILNAEQDFKLGKKTRFFSSYLSYLLRFLTVFVLKFGFLDGKTGFFIAKTTAHATFLRNMKLYEMWKNKN
ncbi:MAG TPA: glycosyltransferase family 2 protein [Bacteroidales bacterium]|nr:glycosyltransferase family 2 protein [Bacteroidales bacterium]